MTYAKMANDLSIPLCEDPCDWGDEYRHQKGGVFSGVVHWRRDRVTRAGIYEFLKLCAVVTHPENKSLDISSQIYLNSMWATKTARTMRIVIPSVVTRYDRLRVRSLLSSDTPSSDPVYKWTHKETI
jgi:hypothetical protein